jgi:hypothetical protein
MEDARRTFPLERKLRQVRDNLGKLLGQDVHRLLHENQLGIISYEAACRSQVNHAGSSRSNDAKGVNMLQHNQRGPDTRQHI